MGAGGAGMLVGPPLLAGGSLRARRALDEQGLYVDPTYGQISWGLIGAQYALSILSGPLQEADPNAGAAVSLMSLGCYVGAIVTGGMQMAENRRAFFAATYDHTASLDVRVLPWTDGRNRGVAFAVAF